jgi:uroporphyrinogen decarboxylase
MSGKQRLELLLAGGVPDVPPHWEIGFQIEKEMFGLDTQAVRDASYASDAAREEALLKHDIQVQHRLIDEFGWAAVNGYSPQQVAALKKEVGGKALVCMHDWGAVFSMPSGEKIMDFVTRLYEQPQDLHAEARQRVKAARERYVRFADAGVDFYLLACDFGFNDQPFVSPEHFREFVAPYLAECVQAVHDLGKPAILHSDGCLTQILDQIHATGIDGYQSIDPQGHMDIQVVRQQYPDWLLMGNVQSSLLQDVDESAIRRCVRYCMRHGGIGKRYIFSTSNVIFAGMPPESYRIMLDEYRLCGDDTET